MFQLSVSAVVLLSLNHDFVSVTICLHSDMILVHLWSLKHEAARWPLLYSYMYEK